MTKPTVAAVNEELQALKTMVAEMAKQIESLEVSNVQLRAEVLELKATKSVAPAKKPNEPKIEDGVFTFIPGNCNVTAVSTQYRDAVRLDGNIVKCTPAVWAFWKTTLERRQKAPAK